VDRLDVLFDKGVQLLRAVDLDVCDIFGGLGDVEVFGRLHCSGIAVGCGRVMRSMRQSMVGQEEEDLFQHCITVVMID